MFRALAWRYTLKALITAFLLATQVGKDVLTMSLPAEMLLPCSELQKQAEEMVRADETPAQHKLRTVAVPEGKVVSLTPSIVSAGVQRAPGPGEQHTLPCPGTYNCS